MVKICTNVNFDMVLTSVYRKIGLVQGDTIYTVVVTSWPPCDMCGGRPKVSVHYPFGLGKDLASY